MRRPSVFVALAALALLGVADGARLAVAQTADPVVFAAASLKNALDAIAGDWRRETGKHATISYAASSTLAKQIENGAPADLFISADRDWMDFLQHSKLIKPESRVDLLGNRLVLIAPKDSKIDLVIRPGFDIAGALGGGRLAMADPAAVPAGLYGKSPTVSPPLRMSGPPCCWWRAAKPRSASSTRPMRPPSRESGSSPPSRPTRTRRSSIRWR
jgi:molybdate transport system substrate-binding protein